LSRESGMPKEDLLSQLSRLLPDVIDKLTPQGKVPPNGRPVAWAHYRTMQLTLD